VVRVEALQRHHTVFAACFKTIHSDCAVPTVAVHSVWQLSWYASWSPLILPRQVTKKIYYVKNSITFTQLHVLFTYKLVL
jgi:hypothetical protein